MHFVFYCIWSSGYLLWFLHSASVAAVICKAVPIWSLAVMSYYCINGTRGKFLALGLLLASVGDILLAVDHFQLGLSSFLLMHVCYISVFVSNLQYRTWKLLPLAILIIYAIGFSTILASHLQQLAIPVYCYIAVITLMCISALFFKTSTHLAFIGSIIFLLSDSLIAYDKFLATIPHVRYCIMITYYLAQYLIFRGLRFA